MTLCRNSSSSDFCIGSFPFQEALDRDARPSQSFLGGLSRVQLFCSLVDCSPPGLSVRGVLQARTLEWVAMPSSRGSSRPRDRTWVSYVSCIGRWVLYHSPHLGSPSTLMDTSRDNIESGHSTASQGDMQLTTTTSCFPSLLFQSPRKPH